MCSCLRRKCWTTTARPKRQSPPRWRAALLQVNYCGISHHYRTNMAQGQARALLQFWEKCTRFCPPENVHFESNAQRQAWVRRNFSNLAARPVSGRPRLMLATSGIRKTAHCRGPRLCDAAGRQAQVRLGGGVFLWLKRLSPGLGRRRTSQRSVAPGYGSVSSNRRMLSCSSPGLLSMIIPRFFAPGNL